MPGTTITIAVFSVIILLVGAIFYAQARERARAEKVRKISQLKERNRSMQQLLHDLPPQYLNNDLRVMLAERAIQSLTALVSLTEDSRLKGQIEQNQEFLVQLREKNPKFAAVPVKDEANAKDIRKMLELLHRFIETQHKRKQIDTSSVKQYLAHINFSICQSKAEMFDSKAEVSNKAGKPRVAIHNYHNAISAFKELANQPAAAKAISHYQIRIKELEMDADKNNQQLKQSAQEKLDKNPEWDKYLEDDDQWQKKNTYDG